jgi:hypothetical protein
LRFIIVRFLVWFRLLARIHLRLLLLRLLVIEQLRSWLFRWLPVGMHMSDF